MDLLIAIDPQYWPDTGHAGRLFLLQEHYKPRHASRSASPVKPFKAFVYAAALEKGYTPATGCWDAPVRVVRISNWRLLASAL